MRPREDPDRILRSALRVFAQYGFKKATLDDIAADLGMTKGNLYRYARNKQDLYRATVASALERWQMRVRSAIEAQADPRIQFDTMCLTAVSYLADDDDLRRGQPTCHKKFDEATAILAGDGLLTEAFGLMCSCRLDRKSVV